MILSVSYLPEYAPTFLFYCGLRGKHCFACFYSPFVQDAIRILFWRCNFTPTNPPKGFVLADRTSCMLPTCCSCCCLVSWLFWHLEITHHVGYTSLIPNKLFRHNLQSHELFTTQKKLTNYLKKSFLMWKIRHSCDHRAYTKKANNLHQPHSDTRLLNTILCEK